MRLHEHIASQRRDWFFKLANELCRKYDVIAIEDLNLKGMQALWGRKESDLAYGMLKLKCLPKLRRKAPLFQPSADGG